MQRRKGVLAGVKNGDVDLVRAGRQVGKIQLIGRKDDRAAVGAVNANPQAGAAVMRTAQEDAAVGRHGQMVGYIAAVKRQPLLRPGAKGERTHRRGDLFDRALYAYAKMQR